MRTLQLTDAELESGITQIGARLDDLKRTAVECKNFNRIQELTEFNKPIQSLFNKLLRAEKTK